MKRLLRCRLAVACAACAFLGVVIGGDSACQAPFPYSPSGERLTVTVTAGPASSPASRRALSFTTPDIYTVTVTAFAQDGSVDKGFNGYVRLSSLPGSVQAVTGPNTNGRNVLLQNGVAAGVNVAVLAAYGNTFIEADDVGYVPADPARVCTPGTTCPPQCKVGQPCPPQCANGIDDNDNGLIDDPADPGCYLANDDTENGGTYSAGVSQILYYYIPRIADVNGGPQGGTAGTPFPNQAVQINTGYLGANAYAFSVIVTDVSSSGFYVTDTAEDAVGGGGFGSVFAYNFDAPPNMRACDRLRSFGGTTADFHGFTEVNYPTWELEEWDPTQRPCLIPEPHDLAPTCPPSATNCTEIAPEGSTSTPMLSIAAALTRLASTPGAPAPASWQWLANPPLGPNGSPLPNLQPAGASAPATTAGTGTIFHIGTLSGPAHPCGPRTCAGCCDLDGQCHTGGSNSPSSPTCSFEANGQQVSVARAPAYTPTPGATSCDLDDSGKVDYTDPDEDACATLCTANLECSEYTTYSTENEFNLVAQTITWNVGDQWLPPAVADGGTVAPDAGVQAPTVANVVVILGNGSTDPTFNPVPTTGLRDGLGPVQTPSLATPYSESPSLGSFTGTLYYFSGGGGQFTIQARCQDDIVPLGSPPVPSDTACVHARTILDTDQGSN